jgi:hypothetical protein
MEGEVTSLSLPDADTFKREIEAINNFQNIVRANMKDGQDFGTIPGTSKPTLLKPGAEKITKLLGLADKYEIVSEIEDWNKPLFYYKLKCSLISVKTGVLITEGFGSCNSMESKYRWRDTKRKCPNCGTESIIKGKAEYGGGWLCFAKKGGCGAKWADGAKEIEGQTVGQIENDDIFSIVNTLLKMAEKRALVDAALHAGRLSEVFTQDIEDMPMGNSVVDSAPEKAKDVTPSAKPAVAPVVQKEAPTPSGGGNDKGEAQKLQRDPSTIKNATELFKACSEDWPDKFKSTKDVNAALGIKAWLEWGGTVAEAYIKIAGVMQK